MDAKEEQYASDLQSVGDAILGMRQAEGQAFRALERMDNVALWEQLGTLSQEINTFARMVQQHRIDRAG